MNVIEKIFGHPEQVQPAHIVVTSPYFRVDEICFTDKSDKGRHDNNYHNAPIDEIVELKKAGMGYTAIAKKLGLSFSATREWHLKATGQFRGRTKRSRCDK